MIKLDIQRFAGSTFEFGASGYLQGRIVWSSSSNGSVANSSNVSATLQVHRTNSATTTGTWSGSLNINGDNRGWSWYGSIGNGWVSVSSFTITVGHNSDGSKVCYIGGSVTGPSGTSLAGKTSSGAQNVTLDKIDRFATMTSATNFTDESNPSFVYTNPANTSMSCWLEINPTGEHLAVRNFSGTGGTYTWELTNEEREQLRAKIPNNSSATCRIGLYSTLGGSTQASFKDMTFSIVNGNPIFSNFTFEDINSTTLALTGDSSKNVNGFSTIKATISVANKAEAIKSASMSKYRFTIGTTSTDITYSDEESVSGNISNATSGTYNIYAIDSRNNSTLVTKLASEEIAYTPINFVSSSCKVERNNGGVGKFAILTINGDIWNDNFGQVSNSITSVLIEYKETSSSTWLTSPTTITPTISGNSFNFTGQVASQEQDYSFELNKSYDFRITIEDELSTKTIQLTPMSSSIPNISLADEGVGIMCDYDESLGGDLQVGGKIIDGLNRYDLSNEVIIGYWGNEPIYRKCVYISSFPNATTTSTDLSALSINYVVNLYGTAKSSSSTFPINNARPDNSTAPIGVWFDGNILRIATSIDRSNCSGYIIIEYTKTTN